MSERQRVGRPGPSADDAENDEDTAHLDEVNELAARMMARAQQSLRDLGLTDSNEFLNATRQSGGQ